MLVTRYLFKNLLHSTLFVAISLTLVIWLTQSMKLLELVANSDAPPSLFLKLVLLTLPKFLEIILPLSLVVSILFSYNKLIMDNELIVLRACGVDQYALARSGIILAIGISVLLTVMSFWVTPKCISEVQQLRQTVKTKYSAFLLREGVFNTFGDKITVYLRSRQPNGDMLGLMIHDTRDKNAPPVTILAKKGRVIEEGGVPQIIVFDGMRQQMDESGKSVSKLYFSRYTIEVNGLQGTGETRWRNPNERTMGELFNPDRNNQSDLDNLDVFRAEIHRRVISPWNALSFTMISLAAILLGPFNRRGQAQRIFFGALMVALVQTLNIVLTNLSKKHGGLVPLIYLNTMIPVALGFYFLHLKGELQLMSWIRRWKAYTNRHYAKEASA